MSPRCALALQSEILPLCRCIPRLRRSVCRKDIQVACGLVETLDNVVRTFRRDGIKLRTRAALAAVPHRAIGVEQHVPFPKIGIALLREDELRKVLQPSKVELVASEI
jgi:hypothetical protein